MASVNGVGIDRVPALGFRALSRYEAAVSLRPNRSAWSAYHRQAFATSAQVRPGDSTNSQTARWAKSIEVRWVGRAWIAISGDSTWGRVGGQSDLTRASAGLTLSSWPKAF